MAIYDIFLIALIIFPGIIGEGYYQFLTESQKFSFGMCCRIFTTSILAYTTRCLIGMVQGFGAAGIFVYFETVENVVKYIIITMITSFLIVNSYVYLEEKILPLWKVRQSTEKMEAKTHE